MSKDRRSKDQKRKAKLEKRAKRTRDAEVLPYQGKKYRRNDLIPTFYHTELGIHEAYVTYDRKLTDDMVVGALTTLIQQLRQGSLPPPTDPDAIEEIEGNEEEFIVQNIRRHWELLFRDSPRPVKEDLVGILRTTLGSIEIWATGIPGSRQYLGYIESFLGVRQCGPTPQLNEDFILSGERASQDLLALGKVWRDQDDQRAAIQFVNQAMHMANKGQSGQVALVCDQLADEYGDNDRFASLLRTISREASRATETDNHDHSDNGAEGEHERHDVDHKANGMVAALLSAQAQY